jgi:DNA (cytosine-5)-methyltransferase 1
VWRCVRDAFFWRSVLDKVTQENYTVDMAAYYNEIDPFAAAWLRELIKAGHIAPGDVDERSITDVHPHDLRGFVQCHFFAGIGVWSYALRKAGWRDNQPVWTGSCPCQPFSLAGKRAGIADERHLWPAWFRLIQECKPPVIFGEQVESAIKHGWLDLVQTELEREDYAVGAVCLPAASVGAPHIRQRLYFCASHSDSTGLPQRDEPRESGAEEVSSSWREFARVHAAEAWKEREAESRIPVFVDGTPHRVGRTRGYGNAIVGPLAEAFIRSYMDAIK